MGKVQFLFTQILNILMMVVFFLIFLLELIYSVMSISAVQKSDLVIHVYKGSLLFACLPKCPLDIRFASGCCHFMTEHRKTPSLQDSYVNTVSST